MNVFVIDVAKCNGCHNCQIACKDEHYGTDWPPYAKAQPETGQFWARVDEHVRGTVPVVKISYKPTLCNHCGNAPCMAAAHDGAVYRREDGLVIIDPEKARGQKQIVESCPIGAVYWNEEHGLPQKCTGCAHLLDAGWDAPRCVDACATDALRFGPLEAFEDELAEAEVSEALVGRDAHVFYLNLPKRFVAGALVDFDADEVVIGARVTLSTDKAVAVGTLESDGMGDFFFAKVEPGLYTLTVEKAGYRTRIESVDVTDRDACLGDLSLEALQG